MVDLETSILDEGLDLAMAWGDDWLSPIQERLSRTHPDLSSDDLAPCCLDACPSSPLRATVGEERPGGIRA